MWLSQSEWMDEVDQMMETSVLFRLDSGSNHGELLRFKADFHDAVNAIAKRSDVWNREREIIGKVYEPIRPAPGKQLLVSVENHREQELEAMHIKDWEVVPNWRAQC